MLPLLAGALTAALLGFAPTDNPGTSGRHAADTSSSVTLAGAGRTTASRALRADSIVVEKRLRRLTLFLDGQPVKRYGVALGRNPEGKKVQIGDFRTPEGVYYIESRMPESRFYRALRISYPDQLDRLRAQSLGLTAGGDILIHGLPNGREYIGASHRRTDWTEGCIAVTNQELDEIWAAVPDGAVIQIKP